MSDSDATGGDPHRSQDGKIAGQDKDVRGQTPAAAAVLQPSSMMGTAEDLSFIVMNNGSCPQSMQSNQSMSMDENNLAHGLVGNPNDIKTKLMHILRESHQQKEAMKENNMALRGQFDSLSDWTEELRQRGKKAKSDQITANASLQKLKEENEYVIKENINLKDQVMELEEKIAFGKKHFDAQEKAERRVCELAEERAELLRGNMELKKQVVALKEVLTSNADLDGYVLFNNEDQPKNSLDSTITPDDPLKNLSATLGGYEERLTALFTTLVGQVESFTDVYKWLNESIVENTDSLSATGTFLEMVLLSLKEAQQSSVGHRLRLEEASQQLGRLRSDFEGTLQDYSCLSNGTGMGKAGVQQNKSLAVMQDMVDSLNNQLLEAEETLTLKDKNVAQLNASLLEKEAAITKMSLELQQQKNSKSLMDEVSWNELSVMANQILQLKEALEQKEKHIEEHSLTVSQIAEMQLKIFRAEKEASKKMIELVDSNDTLKNLEETIFLLEAQCDAYKMDFTDERRSKDKIFAEKQRFEGELDAAQQEIDRLNAELEKFKKN